MAKGDFKKGIKLGLGAEVIALVGGAVITALGIAFFSISFAGGGRR